VKGVKLKVSFWEFQMAIQLYTESNSEKSVGIVYILCDCQNAIAALTIQDELNRFPEIHAEVSCLQDSVEKVV